MNLLPLLFLLGNPPAPYTAARPLMTPARFLEGVVSVDTDDAHVSFSPDGRELYFIRSTPDFAHWTVLLTRFANGRWSTPEVAPFSGRWNDADVSITRDNKRMFFISNRPLTGEGPPRPDTEVWTIERTASRWGKPWHFDELSSPGDEWFPNMTDDGTLYFGSERPGGKGKSDLWRAKWQGDHFGPPENLGDAINTPNQEIEPFISPDERFMIFAANGRPDGKGAYDLFATFRCEGKWTTPKPLGAGVNTEGWEFGPRISPDGRYLFFTSTRSEYDPAPAKPRTAAELARALRSPGNGLRDVYQVEMQALDLHSPCEGH